MNNNNNTLFQKQYSLL